MKLKKSLAALAAAGLVVGLGSAQAGMLINDWQINLGGLGVTATDDWTGYGVFGPPTGINEMSFNALYHGVITKAGAPVVGGIQTIDVVGKVSAAIGSGGNVVVTDAGKVHNFDFELTFKNTTSNVITSFNAITGDNKTRHLGPGATDGLCTPITCPDGLDTNGYLSIYANILPGRTGYVAGQVAGNTNFLVGGQGMMDGTLIARFKIVPAVGDSGSFNNSPAAMNGQDDATFELVYNSGAIEDSSGVDLALGTTIALVDSDTDADPDGNQAFDTAPANFPAGSPLGPCPTPGTASGANSCGTENGSFVLQQVPEPGTLALLGAALAGLSAVRRRRQ